MSTAFPLGPRGLFAAWAFGCSTFLFLVASTWIGHSDPGDAQVYAVVARHLAGDWQWTHLHYLPDVHPQFHEHLPFSIWVMAVLIRLFGEGSLAPAFFLFSLAVVLLSGFGARRLAGEWAGLTAIVILATTMHFFKDAGHALLDPLMLPLATGAALPVLLGKPGWRGWALATVLAAAAIAVKGPFGVLPLVGASVARAIVDRSWRHLAVGAAASALAAVPTMAFLWAHPDWWQGYFLDQVWASATGARTDGVLSNPFYPIKVIAGRFWPGMLFVVAALAVAFGLKRLVASDAHRRAAILLGWQCLVIVVLLCIPGRKMWHHTLVAYPAMAMWGGVAVGPWLDRALASVKRARIAVAGLGALACVGLVASLAGIHRLYLYPPCLVSREFASTLHQLPDGATVLIVSPDVNWDLMSALAWETHLVPRPRTQLERGAAAAIVDQSSWAAPPGWTERVRARGWVLATPQ